MKSTARTIAPPQIAIGASSSSPTGCSTCFVPASSASAAQCTCSGVRSISGRPAPAHPGGIPNLPDWVTREAYSHEVASCGFWPGGGSIAYPAFYAYAYPVPAGFATATVKPAEAFYSRDYGEFILPYDVVRQSPSPDATLLEFLQTTYEAAADLGKWDRESLERKDDPRLGA